MQEEELTWKRALELAENLLTWSAETGGAKADWPGWKENGGEYTGIIYGCFLCEFNYHKVLSHRSVDPIGPFVDEVCPECPYHQKFGGCFKSSSPVSSWERARHGYDKEKVKKYASILLGQVRQLKEEVSG